MARNVHTVIFVPNARARFRQVQISSRALWCGAAVLAGLLALGVLSTALFFRSLGRTRLMASVVAENRDLRERSRDIAGKLSAIERQLARFEEQTRRLSVVSGLTALNDPGTGGVGGMTALGGASPSSSEGLRASLEETVRRSGLVSSRLEKIEARLTREAERLAFMPTIAPTNGVLTAGFGPRPDPFTGRNEIHNGLDVSTAIGNRIVAPAAGTVVRITWESGYGRVLEIAHAFGVTTRYGHLEATRVNEGQRVKRGELIALVGTTGRSTGPHLHYEVHVNGRPVDPLAYVLNAY